MKLIATTRIGNLPVKIYERDDLQEKEECFGVTVETTEGVEIVLQSGLTPERFHDVFFHELIHAAEWGMGLELKHTLVNQLGLGLGSAMHLLNWERRQPTMPSLGTSHASSRPRKKPGAGVHKKRGYAKRKS